MSDSRLATPSDRWGQQLHQIVFEADTSAGRAFDVAVLVTILLSTLTVILESVSHLRANYGRVFLFLEWCFTILFTVEYLLRLLSVRRPLQYATSFFGIVDLLAIVPTYLRLLVPGSHYLIVIRILRLLRIFRVLKLSEYLHEATILQQALRASRRKISVFLLTVLTLVVIIGAAMYVIEGRRMALRTFRPVSIGQS